jgi:hypothetical protein
MTDNASTTCPSCGAAASGKFCASCGTALGPAPCAACGTALAPGAKFCHSCGSPLGRSAPSVDRAVMSTEGATRPSGDRTPWFVAMILVAAIIMAVAYSATKRSGAAPPAMSNAGNAGAGGAQDPSVVGTTMAAPNIDSLTPKERFLRLQTRIDQQLERRDTTRLTFFMQMALQAYGLLPETDRDVDVRFHAAMLNAEAGMLPQARALADTIMKAAPDNLLGYYLRASIAGFAGDSATARTARTGFQNHFDAEIKKNRPEYLEHRPLLDQYHKGDGAK